MNAQSKPKGFPPISAELMRELEARWPNKLPPAAEKTTLEDLRVLQGEQNVVRLLRHQFDIQNTTINLGR